MLTLTSLPHPTMQPQPIPTEPSPRETALAAYDVAYVRAETAPLPDGTDTEGWEAFDKLQVALDDAARACWALGIRDAELHTRGANALAAHAARN